MEARIREVGICPEGCQCRIASVVDMLPYNCPMKTEKRKYYYADDGSYFTTAEACLAYENDAELHRAIQESADHFNDPDDYWGYEGRRTE